MTDSKPKHFAEYLNQTLTSPETNSILALPEGHEAQAGFKHYTRQQIRRLCNQAATYLIKNGLHPRQRGERALIVTLLGYGTVEWAILFYAVSRMGHTVCSLSSRLSDQYVTGLLEKSKSDILIHDRQVTLPSNRPQLIVFPTLQQIREEVAGDEEKLICDSSAVDPEDTVQYSHSSGSTNLPKLFPVSHAEWLARLDIVNGVLPKEQSAWWASAMYNAVGLLILSVAPARHSPSYFENDRVQFTKEGALVFITEAQPDSVGITPYTLGLVASSEGGLDMLKKAASVAMFGAVCPDELGDMLVSEGVNLSSLYAMTEAGTLMTSAIRPKGDDEWQWCAVPPPRLEVIKFRPITSGSELYQMWCTPDCAHVLPVCRDKDGWFCTGDLFLKHPTKENRWKVVGRQDDQLKIYQKGRQSIVNAIVYEQKIHSGNEDIVEDVILFGQGRGSLGLLVFAENAVEGSTKRIKAEQRIWKSIETEINGKLKTGIERSMIVIVDTKRVSLPQTGKFNLIRPQVYLRFKDVIDQAYVQQAAQPTPEAAAKTNGHTNITNGHGLANGYTAVNGHSRQAVNGHL